MELINQFKILPKDIVHIIMEYSNYKLRNGIYIRQLNKNMQIFNLLSKKKLVYDDSVDLFIQYIKRKSYCLQFIKISYNNYYGYYSIRKTLDEFDYDDTKYEITEYYEIKY